MFIVFLIKSLNLLVCITISFVLLCFTSPEVAKAALNRCLTTNEEVDSASREDRNFQVTFNYEFLEDDRDPPPGFLAKLCCK